MSQNAYVPSGESGETTGNWLALRRCAGDDAAQQVEGDVGPAEAAEDRHAAAVALPQTTSRSCPLFIGPRWSTYSTRYFHCYCTKKNFFGDPIFTTFPDNILSFTRICPGGKVGP